MKLTGSDTYADARYSHRGRKLLSLVVLSMSLGMFALIGFAEPAKRDSWFGVATFPIPFVAFAIGAYMYVVPVKLECPGCKKLISAEEPWRCGRCQREHPKISELGRHSFLDRCANGKCAFEATAYECHFCRTIIYLTKDKDGRVPARSLHPQEIPLPEPTPDKRQILAEEIAVGEATKRVMELDRDKLGIAIDQARLRRDLDRKEPVVETEEQKQVNRIASLVADAERTCKTVPETVQRELEEHGKIDRTQYHHDPEINAHIQSELKQAVSVAFERVRMGSGVNVRIQKDHSKSGL
jgi:hypothetical protein